jgi:hypothetical protein
MSGFKRVVALVGLCVGCLLIGLLVWQVAMQQGARAGVEEELHIDEVSYPNCRFGVTSGLDPDAYDMPGLNVGWYLNWRVTRTPSHPGGAEYVHTVRLTQEGMDYTVTPPLANLLTMVDDNPATTWLIGNEPDGYPIASHTDSIDPAIYARAYHDLYQAIKGRDPTARVGNGAIIQPTPLRYQYLDTVWDAYFDTYSTTMPVDVWNIHSFILRETTIAPDPEPCGENTVSIWGAFVPRGSASPTGNLYCLRDQDDIEIFWQRIRGFRQWMADRGQRDKPLIITEYGVLFPEDYTDEDGRFFSQTRVGTFMTETFDRMLTETDPGTGYAYDANRLVQRWAWYSLSEDPTLMGGALFDPKTGQLRELGQMYQNYTSAITPTVDLLAARAFASPSAYWWEDAPVTATLKAVISNIGNISATTPFTVTFYDGPPGQAGTNPIGSPSVIADGLGGCADLKIVEAQWPGLQPGAHYFYVEVTTSNDDGVDNNTAAGVVLVASHRQFLPQGSKAR